MSDFNTWSTEILWTLLEVTAGASLCFLLILAVQRALGQQLRANWRYALWGVLLVRMLLPINYEAALFTLLTIPRNEPAPIADPALAPPADTIDAITEISGPVDLAPSTPSVQITAPAKTLPTTAPSPSKPRERPIAAALFTLWLLGACAVITRVLTRHTRLSRMIERNALPAPESVSHVLRRVRDELSIAIWPAALVTSAIATPTVVGAFRPRVLLPKDLAETASAEELRLILMHELVHIQRRDLFVAWLWLLALALHWFNPLMWVAGVLMRRDREKACDQRVLAALPDQERIAYGHTLLKAVASVDPKSGFNHYAGTAAIVENEAELAERLTMVRDYRPSRALHRILGAITAMVLTGVAFTQFWAVGQESPKRPPKPAATATANPFADISDDEQLELLANQAAEKGNLILACEATMQRIHVQAKRSPAPYDRILLTDLFSRIKTSNPSLTDTAKRQMIIDLDAYAATHPGVEYQWRVALLQETIAANLGDLQRANDYIARAIKVYPTVTYQDPYKDDAFGILVKEQAALIWKGQSQQAAEDYYVSMWRNDARLVVWPVPDWYNENVLRQDNSLKQFRAFKERMGKKPISLAPHGPTTTANAPAPMESSANPFADVTDEAELTRLRDEAGKSGDLIRACEAEMRRVKLRAERGNAYKDKIDLVAAYSSLLINDDVVKQSLDLLPRYAAAHVDDPDYAWRIWHLRSVILGETDDDAQRKDALAQAIRAYPQVKYADPSKHSKFQHLVNEEAMVIWDMQGFDAAEKFVVDLWKKDRRFAYFYAQPWKERYVKEKLSADRLEKLQAAMGEKTPLTEVKVLLTPDGLWYVEKPARMDEIAKYLEQIPLRANFFVSLGYTDDNISIKTWQDAKNQLLRLVQKLGFDHFSDIGKQPADAAVKTDIGTYIEIELPFFIAADGTYILNGKTVADDALKETLSSAPPDAHLILRVDPSAPSGRAQNVLAAAKEAGIKNVSIDEPDATKENAPQK